MLGSSIKELLWISARAPSRRLPSRSAARPSPENIHSVRCPSGELGDADTIVQRLDNATFGEDGVAETRIQLRALQLESVAPFKTSCGDYNIRVVAHGQQPITKMRIIKETANGGRYVAPVRVNFKLTFMPADGISASASA